MKKSFRVLKLLILAPILMAFQCDNDLDSDIVYNIYKINITPKTTFSINDTIWIEGRVSAKAFDTILNDSIFNENKTGNQFSIFKFITPTEHSNAKDAIDSFDLVYQKGDYSFLSSCENAQLTAYPELNADGKFYVYKLGLKPKFKGDFIISGLEGEIRNIERNLSIAEKYPIARHPNQIGFLKCDAVSWLGIQDSTRDFLFSVD